MTNDQHYEAIAALPVHTRDLVIDALRVRAMDFVGDRLNDDNGDQAADIYRAFYGSTEERDQPFDPDRYDFLCGVCKEEVI